MPSESRGSTSVINRPPPPSLDVNQCHLKKGRCQTHDIQARKIITNEKKWGKLKYGYGWINRRRVHYECRVQSLAQVDPRISPGSVDNLPDKPAIVGQPGNVGYNEITHLSESTRLGRQNKDTD